MTDDVQAVVIATLRVDRSALSCGSKVWVLSMSGGCRIECSATSRGGRKIKIWIDPQNLHRARIKNIPKSFAEKLGVFYYHGRSAQEVCDILNGLIPI